MTELLWIVEKIDMGIRDHETTAYYLNDLWRHPFVREIFLALLRASERNDPHYDLYRRNFEIVCTLHCPEFLLGIDSFLVETS